jgi:hypothetical protein
MGIRNFNLQRSQIKKGGGIGLFHFFVLTPPKYSFENIPIFYLPFLNSLRKTVFLGRKILEGHLSLLHPLRDALEAPITCDDVIIYTYMHNCTIQRRILGLHM